MKSIGEIYKYYDNRRMEMLTYYLSELSDNRGGRIGCGELHTDKEQSPANQCELTFDEKYYQCLEDKYQCGNNGYMKKVFIPTFANYRKIIDDGLFDENARLWLYSVNVCLQYHIQATCEFGPIDCTCLSIKQIAVEMHPHCYLKHGFCDLSPRYRRIIKENAVMAAAIDRQIVIISLNPQFIKKTVDAIPKCFD